MLWFVFLCVNPKVAISSICFRNRDFGNRRFVISEIVGLFAALTGLFREPFDDVVGVARLLLVEDAGPGSEGGSGATRVDGGHDVAVVQQGHEPAVDQELGRADLRPHLDRAVVAVVRPDQGQRFVRQLPEHRRPVEVAGVLSVVTEWSGGVSEEAASGAASVASA